VHGEGTARDLQGRQDPCLCWGSCWGKRGRACIKADQCTTGRDAAKARPLSGRDNLYLNITKSGAKSWIFLYRSPVELSEMQLGHALRSRVEAAYRRQDMMERRRVMMEAWERFLDGKAGADVIPLRAHQT
jgi:hypothetical protein